MWGGMAGLVLQLIAGAVGGSVIGTTLKRYDLGMVGNLLAGIIGGGIERRSWARWWAAERRT
jgi:hypothetical protein